MIELIPLSASDFAKGNWDAATVAAQARSRGEAEFTDPEHRTPFALTDFQEVLTELLDPFLQPDDDQTEMLAELLRRSDDTGKTEPLRKEGITEAAIIRLAQRISQETSDLGEAWLTLQDAMDVAVRVQQDGHGGSNQGDFVDEVLRRVAELARDGEYDVALAEIDAALEAEKEASEARQNKLLIRAIDVARLKGDAEAAAARVIAQADLAAGGQADIATLRELLHRYMKRGHDKGIALDQHVAIAMAREIVPRVNRAGFLGGSKSRKDWSHGQRQQSEPLFT